MSSETFTQSERDGLWERRRSDDQSARDELIVYYLPLARRIARYIAMSLPQSLREDLEGFAAIGLIDAVDKFRPELGNRFETYAAIRIRGAIADGLRVLNWLPRDAHRRESGKIRIVEVVDFQAQQTPSGKHLGDTLADSEESPLDLVINEEDLTEVNEVVDALPDRERTIVIDRYYKNRLLRQIGQDFKLTESRICQLHRRALHRIHEKLMELRTA